MKKYATIFVGRSFLLLLIGSLALSCNQPKQKNTSTPEQAVQVEATSDKYQQSSLSQWQEEIQLDQGQPWEANQATTDGIKNMSKIIQNSEPTSATAYQELAIALNEEMNILIQKCTMTGPSHDNLHVYLEPLLLKLSELTQTQNSEDGARTTQKIMHHLDQYDTYFF